MMRQGRKQAVDIGIVSIKKTFPFHDGVDGANRFGDRVKNIEGGKDGFFVGNRHVDALKCGGFQPRNRIVGFNELVIVRTEGLMNPRRVTMRKFFSQ